MTVRDGVVTDGAFGVTLRDVEVAGLSVRAELLAVLRVAALIVFGVWLYLENRPDGRLGPGSTAQQAKNLLPFQAVVTDKSVDDQRMFRSLQVASIEAENVRSTTGNWPDVATLAAEGIDPFALDPTRKSPRYTWHFLRQGYAVHYVGLPDMAGASAWLLLVQEPDPSVPPEPYQADEEHARLLDGTILHVSIWQHANGPRVPVTPVRLAQAEGWVQLFAVGPSATH
jgi:hypothetical protein